MNISPLKYHGGQTYSVPIIQALLSPHRTFCDVTAGGLSVLLASQPEGRSEIINDIDGHLIAFWRTLQSETLFPVFRQIMEATPFNETSWQESRDYLTSETTPPPDTQAATLNSAKAVFICSRMSLGGRNTSFAVASTSRVRRGMNEQVSAWLSAVDGLPAAHARLKRVMILNRDILGALSYADSTETQFYVDPPYLTETRVSTKVYRHEMTVQKHEELLQALASIRGRFLLCSYPSAMYTAAIAQHGWYYHDHVLDNKSSHRKVKEDKTARFVLNYRPETALEIKGGPR